MVFKKLLTLTLAISVVSAASANFSDIASTPELSASFYQSRKLQPPTQARKEVDVVLKSYPDADLLLVGNNGTPFAIRGNFGRVAKSGRVVTAKDLASVIPVLAGLYGLKPANLSLHALVDDDNGMKHAAFDVTMNGLPVRGASILAHISKDGRLTSTAATVPDEVEIPSPHAVADIEAAKISTNAKLSGKAKKWSNGSLVYFIPSQNQPMFLAWEIQFTVDANSEFLLHTAYVNAISGEVIEIRDRIQNAKSRSVRDLNGAVGYVSSTSSFYIPNAVSRSEGGASVASSSVNNAYDNTGIVYDYFNGTHGRDGPDGRGGTINTIVNSLFTFGSTTTGDNAFYTGLLSNGSSYLYCGTGNSSSVNSSSALSGALDVIGHEYTHWVLDTRGIGSLGSGINETGAINEGIADMFGAMSKYSSTGLTSNTWLMNDIRGTPYRSLADPQLYSGQDYYPNYVSTADIHVNAGIADLAFKLACTGGTHPRPSGKTPVTVPSLGIATARDIFYRGSVNYAPVGSGYAALKAATYSAAIDNYGTETAANVALAWDAVGVPYGSGNFRAINISTRAWVGTGSEVMIAGFVMQGSGGKNMLLRAVGPTLATFGVSGTLADPFLNLNSVATNDNWWQAPNASAIASAGSAVGAFALGANSNDSAILTSLNAGAYSAQVSGVNGGTGVALVEVYDTDLNNPTKLVNISTRAKVISTENVTAGFVVNGSTGKKLLIRAAGPTLSNFGVSGVLANPQIALYHGGSVIYQNDDWGQAWNLAALNAAVSSAGAFAFNSNSADAAMLVELPPGVYTAIVSGVSGGTGVTLVEVYEVP